ncbi:MAG: response regulator [Deltaproteobacteria bacterium]|nr:response regulator [Deltaproteobacteria bacterium]
MSKRILVIDDEEAVRKSFVLALEETGYQVDTAASGEEGIRLWKKNPYDLVFLDLKMPGMNGVETLRALRSMDSTVQIAERENVEFDIMRKPIGGDGIRLVAKSILERSGL